MKTLFMGAIAVVLAMAARPGSKPAHKGDVYLESNGLKVSQKGYDLILEFEVGGGEVYYNRHLIHPEWPGASSGVTIGVGYDLGYNSPSQIEADWAGRLPSGVIARLKSCSGIKGSAAKIKLRSVRDISVPWSSAIEVYKAKTIPRFAGLTRRAYPGTETLHPSVQGAMLSWVFNRGDGISGSARDLEKRQIRNDIPDHVSALPSRFLSSQRLWIGTDAGAGLCRRRRAEAALIQSTF